MAESKIIDFFLVKYGLIDISSIDSTILVNLVYSSTNNFTGVKLYKNLDKAFFVPEIAYMIIEAQKKLKKLRPDYGLIILDAARPISIQRFMYNLVKGLPSSIYVADPDKSISRHNYGVAVDLSIIDNNKNLLDMGSKYDYFGEASHVGNEEDFIKRGIISKQAAINRALLTNIMIGVGFIQHPKEWWHFDKYSDEEIKKRFRLLDF